MLGAVQARKSVQFRLCVCVCMCPGKYLTLDAFRSEVLLPFLLSQQDLQEACKVPVGHGSSLPSVPDGKSAAGASGSAPTFNDDE